MDQISDNLLAAFLDGNTNADETRRVLEAAMNNPEIRKVIEMASELEEEAGGFGSFIPFDALVARENENRCAVMCELFILKKYGIERTLKDWEKQAVQHGWLKNQGTAVHNIGRLLEQECFSISRTFHNTMEDLKEALKIGDVIVVVDNKEMTNDIHVLNREKLEDEFVGSDPNHAVVITEISGDEIVYYDPEKDGIHRINITLFIDAWEDSSRYMVRVSKRDYRNYEPHPIDLSDVTLPDDLIDLREAIAENAHEIWAQGRKSQGWTYGPQRNDSLKQTPDMVPYSDLTDEEKSFDREMAMNTIKLLKKLGYRIEKE